MSLDQQLLFEIPAECFNHLWRSCSATVTDSELATAILSYILFSESFHLEELLDNANGDPSDEDDDTPEVSWQVLGDLVDHWAELLEAPLWTLRRNRARYLNNVRVDEGSNCILVEFVTVH